MIKDWQKFPSKRGNKFPICCDKNFHQQLMLFSQTFSMAGINVRANAELNSAFALKFLPTVDAIYEINASLEKKRAFFF